ncbi:MAG: DVU0772 family protein [Thermodesulfobacteriota bacterium]
MMTLNDIRQNRQLLNEIDWEMTPEEAVRLYLEWGNNWARGNYVIRSKEDVSHYFVVNTWKGRPVIYLIRRNSEEARDLAQIDIPQPIADRFLDSIGYNKGVYAVDGELRLWLQQLLGLTAATS